MTAIADGQTNVVSSRRARCGSCGLRQPVDLQSREDRVALVRVLRLRNAERVHDVNRRRDVVLRTVLARDGERRSSTRLRPHRPAPARARAMRRCGAAAAHTARRRRARGGRWRARAMGLRQTLRLRRSGRRRSRCTRRSGTCARSAIAASSKGRASSCRPSRTATPAEQQVRERDALVFLRRRPDATRALQIEPGFLQVTLVGEDLAHVAVRQRDVAGFPGALGACACPAVQLDGLVPAALEVGEHAEVVEHRRLVLGIAQLLIDLERAPGVRRLVGTTRFDQRPVEGVGGVGERAQLPDRLRFRDRLRDTAAPPRTSAPAGFARPRAVNADARASSSPRRSESRRRIAIRD